jgi:electron transfer flavoprotein beta subunit
MSRARWVVKIIVCFETEPCRESIGADEEGRVIVICDRWEVKESDARAFSAANSFLDECGGGLIVALSVGGEQLNDPTIQRRVLAQGASEFFAVVDDAASTVNANHTAEILAVAIDRIGDYDLVVCGEESSVQQSHYARFQLGERLGIPCVNAVTSLKANGMTLLVERELEESVERIELIPPALVSLSATIAPADLPGLKDLLLAAERPVTIWNLQELEKRKTSKPASKLRQIKPVQGNTENQNMNFPYLLMLRALRSNRRETRGRREIAGDADSMMRMVADILEKAEIL